MADTRARVRVTAFTTGEVSPLISSARVDLEKYQRACRTLTNFMLLPQGGARRRPGTSYVATAKATTAAPRLIPFVFSTLQAYMLEFGESGGAGYIRFYRNGAVILDGAVPLEVVSPYLAADLADLDYEQSADVLYLVCDGFAPRKLTRTSHTDWILSTITFRPPPTFESPEVMTGSALTLGAVTGNGISVTAASSIFLPGDVGRQLTSGAGRLILTTYTSGTLMDADVLDDFADTAIADGAWSLSGTPNSTLTPGKSGPVGASVSLTSTVPDNVFRSTDVGKYVKLHDGIVKINAFTSAQVVRGEILAELTAATGTSAWSMEIEAWSVAEGYPVAVAFSPGDRLCFAKGTRVWGSVVGDYENMGVSTLDDAAFEFGLNIGQVNEALWLKSSDELVCGSVAAEHVLFGGGVDEVLTPTNVRQSADTNNGSTKVRPARVGPALLHVGASGRDIFEHVYAFEEDRHVAPSLTLLAEHLLPKGQTVTAMAYQRTPYSILWCVRSDGRLLGLTYLRAEEVVGWHTHPMDGTDTVASVAVIPHPDGDREQLWIIAARVIGGVTTYYVEYANDSSLFEDSNGVNYGARGLDSSLIYDGAAATEITGLDHLEGRTVGVIADGAYVEGPFTVTSGAITLPGAATKVEVGLPFSSVLTPVEPEIDGMSAGMPKSVGPLIVRLVNTLGLTYSGGDGINYPVPFRTAAHPMGTPPPLFTGTINLDHLGWDDGAVTFRQDLPLPCTITMIAGVVGVGQ